MGLIHKRPTGLEPDSDGERQGNLGDLEVLVDVEISPKLKPRELYEGGESVGNNILH